MGGEGDTVDGLDADAPWRPGFEWPDEPVELPPAPARPAPPPAATSDPWSRAAVEQPIDWKAWVPPPELRRPAQPPAESPSPVAVVPGAPPSTVSGDLVLGAVIVVALVVAAAFTAVRLLPAPATTDALVVDALPATAALAWSVEVDGRVVTAIAGSGVLVVDTGTQITGFEHVTGDLLWTLAPELRPIARTMIAVDGVVVLADRQAGGPLALRAVDARSGEELWQRSDPSGNTRIIDRWVLEFGVDGPRKTLQLVDLRTGGLVGPAYGLGPAIAPLPRIVDDDGTTVSVWDVDTGTRLAPRIIDPLLRAVDVVEGVLVGFDDANKIVVFDELGRRTDERRFSSDAFGEFQGRAELVGAVPGHDIAILASGSSIGFAVGDGTVDVVWEVAGRVGPANETRIGPVSVARVIDETTGEVNHSLVRSTNGRSLVVTDAGVTRESEPEVRWDGYVLAPEVGRTERVVRAFDFDGNQLWSLDLPSDASWTLADDSVVVLERDLRTTRVSVHR